MFINGNATSKSQSGTATVDSPSSGSDLGYFTKATVGESPFGKQIHPVEDRLTG